MGISPGWEFETKDGVVVLVKELVKVPLVWNLVVEKEGRKLRRGFV